MFINVEDRDGGRGWVCLVKDVGGFYGYFVVGFWDIGDGIRNSLFYSYVLIWEVSDCQEGRFRGGEGYDQGIVRMRGVEGGAEVEWFSFGFCWEGIVFKGI